MFRLRLVLAVSLGRSRRGVAAVCSCDPSTCSRAVERSALGGFEALRDQRRYNGSRKLGLAYLETFHAVLGHQAQDFGWQRPTWTRESLALTMTEQRLSLVSVSTLGRVPRQIGPRRGRPKPTVQCPWPDKLRDKVLRTLRRLEAWASDSEPVLFVDEVDIYLNPKVGLDGCNRGNHRPL